MVLNTAEVCFWSASELVLRLGYDRVCCVLDPHPSWVRVFGMYDLNENPYKYRSLCACVCVLVRERYSGLPPAGSTTLLRFVLLIKKSV